jgi:hypothetical protein
MSGWLKGRCSRFRARRRGNGAGLDPAVPAKQRHAFSAIVFVGEPVPALRPRSHDQAVRQSSNGSSTRSARAKHFHRTRNTSGTAWAHLRNGGRGDYGVHLWWRRKNALANISRRQPESRIARGERPYLRRAALSIPRGGRHEPHGGRGASSLFRELCISSRVARSAPPASADTLDGPLARRGLGSVERRLRTIAQGARPSRSGRHAVSAIGDQEHAPGNASLDRWGQPPPYDFERPSVGRPRESRGTETIPSRTLRLGRTAASFEAAIPK